MSRIRWAGGAVCRRVGALWQHVKLRVDEEWFMLRVTYWSLFYNHLTSWATIFDASMEPMFWFVDHFIRYLGPAFVILVIVLTSSVVLIFYVCLLPHKIEESLGWTIYHFIFGHWLLVNIVYNYFKAAFTDPGHPPMEIPEVVSICKKCIAPKPPRSHHCSVCNQCILKMDHHCPWLNNCVGHFNHRYFFLFCLYMWLGTIYVSISAYPLFKDHFYGDSSVEIGWSGLFYPYYLAKRGFSKDKQPFLGEGPRKSLILDHIDPDGVLPELPPHDVQGSYFHTFIIYEFMLCSAVTFALSILLLWHARLVNKAETSIELHINKAERKRQRKKGIRYKNPYDFGIVQNWRVFLGLTHGRTFWRHILLPSPHAPDEDGLRWRTIWTAHENGILLL